MITLKNEKMTVTVNPYGAEPISIVNADGEELSWHGTEGHWGGTAPILFPFIGRPKNGEYIVNNKEYCTPHHGFLQTSTFSVVSQSDKSVTLILTDSEDTMQSFPFHFEVIITYSLDGNSFHAEYKINNTDNKTMYCSFGLHNSYKLFDDFENYVLKFERVENADEHIVTSNVHEGTYDRVLHETDILPLKYDYFTAGSLTFDGIKSRSVSIVHKSGKTLAMVDYQGLDCLTVWTEVGQPFICTEPWSQKNAAYETERDIACWDRILVILPQKSKSMVQTIKI